MNRIKPVLVVVIVVGIILFFSADPFAPEPSDLSPRFVAPDEPIADQPPPEVFDGELEIEILVQLFPEEIFVTRGTTVTWIIREGEAGAGGDEVWHVVSERNRVFESGALLFNDRFSYTFNELGVFTYGCEHHPWMFGKIVVVDR